MTFGLKRAENEEINLKIEFTMKVFSFLENKETFIEAYNE